MPCAASRREVQRIAVAVAVQENEPVEEHEEEWLFPGVGDEVLVFPQCKKDATTEAKVGSLFEASQTLLASWDLVADL